jgi:hypothetical protein
MLLQCETDCGAAGGIDPAALWLRSETLESLIDLNEVCLELLATQARASCGSPLLAQIAALWSVLDGCGRRRAAGGLYLLLDAGFAHAPRWRASPAAQVGEAARAGYPPFFTVAPAAKVTQAIFTFAWHLARCQGTAARLLLGIPAPCVELIAQRTLRQVCDLAETHPEWLQPRWQGQPEVWRDLLRAAAQGDPRALERARLRGQTLLAAESRRAASEGEREPLALRGAR